jgi:hypothetical protein
MTSCEVSALFRSEWTWRLRWPEGGSRGTAALQKKGKQPKEKSIKPKMNAPANRSMLNNVARGAEALRRHDEPDEEKRSEHATLHTNVQENNAVKPEAKQEARALAAAIGWTCASGSVQPAWPAAQWSWRSPRQGIRHGQSIGGIDHFCLGVWSSKWLTTLFGILCLLGKLVTAFGSFVNVLWAARSVFKVAEVDSSYGMSNRFTVGATITVSYSCSLSCPRSYSSLF